MFRGWRYENAMCAPREYALSNFIMDFGMGPSRNSALLVVRIVAERQTAGVKCSRLHTDLQCCTLQTAVQCCRVQTASDSSTLQTPASQRGTLQTARRPPLLSVSNSDSAMGMGLSHLIPALHGNNSGRCTESEWRLLYGGRRHMNKQEEIFR